MPSPNWPASGERWVLVEVVARAQVPVPVRRVRVLALVRRVPLLALVRGLQAPVPGQVRSPAGRPAQAPPARGPRPYLRPQARTP